MFSKSYCAAVHGIEGIEVQVEADVSDGLPSFDMVGFLASEVKEAKERVKIALRNSGFRLPPKHITINLSPANLKKEGTAFDFSIAIAILAASGYIPQENVEDCIIIGELSLNGNLRRVNGVLPMTLAAKQKGYKRCLLPVDNMREGAVVSDIEVYGVHTLKEAVDFFNGAHIIEPCFVDAEALFQRQELKAEEDFAELSGQLMARRAVEVAAAGMHNLAIIGPPGAGKTMLAKRIPGIMPELTMEESMEISRVYSIAGLLSNHQVLVSKRPFRAPHHTITAAALIGGGRTPIPGEVSLASSGVLFLDELPEFKASTLEVLRQPLEDKKILINRLQGSYHFPANFMLVTALNPCKCGFYPNRERCNCTGNQVRQYLGRISRPLLDRIDICVETEAIAYTDLSRGKRGECSSEIRKRVKEARMIQLERYQKVGIFSNAQLTAKLMEQYCELGKEEEKVLKDAYISMKLSARAYHKILKVSRTIADLAGEKRILKTHLCEAIHYRSFDNKYWGNL